MAKKRSVGIVCLTMIGGVPYAILQRRGTFNTEKIGPESFPGCSQVTCHGGINDDENFYAGFLRESCEELGEAFTRARSRDAKLETLIELKNEEKHVVTYGVIVSSEHLKQIRLGPDTGGLDLVTLEQAKEIIPITKDMKLSGPPAGKRAMFPDEIEAVLTAFAKLTV